MERRLRLVVINSNYPAPDNLYGDVFVHTRLKEYKKKFDVMVVGYNSSLAFEKIYEYEGISVCLTNNLNQFYAKINEIKPQIIAGHFIEHQYFDFLLSLGIPLIVFLHGYEVLSWKRRLMNYTSLGALPYLWAYIKENRIQLNKFRKFVITANKRNNIHFVFVSDWLRKAAQKDVGAQFIHSHTIPNGIDISRFSFFSKDAGLRKKILILRSFKFNNYANDISIEAIRILSNKDFFNDLEFCVYGEGYLFVRLTAKIRHFKNVTLNNFFVENNSIPGIYRNFGILMCPSRLDTQGVSMCEAMASGVVPIASPVGGIPEFAIDSVSSFHISTPQEMADKIEYLYYNPAAFRKMSQQAREQIERKCSLTKTVLQEIKLIESCDLK
jgi:glycosyltransferase involved in cell wall biosynthesis